MALVPAYHTITTDDPKYHVYDDCPSGERIIQDGNFNPGMAGELCELCEKKRETGSF